MDWSITRIKSLREILATIYPKENDARQVVTDVGMKPAQIEFTNKASTTWYYILEKARLETGRLDQIYNYVLDENPDNEELKLLSPPQQWLFKLLEFIGEEFLDELTQDEIAWQAALTNAMPPSSNYEPVATLVDAFRALEDRGNDHKGVLPFFRFIHELSQCRHLKAAVRDKLGDWLDIHCPSGQREQLSTSVGAEVTGEPRIVIQMIAAEKDDQYLPCAPAGSPPPPGAALFRYKVWFVGFRRSPAPEGYVDLREGFPRILERAWAKVRVQYDPRFVWVELFIPKELFAWAVEKEQVCIHTIPAPIGAEHRFVLRFAREGYAPRLETRWNDALKSSKRSNSPILLNCALAFEGVPKQAKDEHFIVALDPDPCNVSAMYFRLQERNSVLGVLWTSVPAAETSARDVWEAVFQNGVPLIMWPRQLPPHPQMEEDPKHLFPLDWDDLAGVVQKLRLTAITDAHCHLGQNLAVILDDPRRPLPSASRKARFRSPASTR